jgi:hypothetical protein
MEIPDRVTQALGGESVQSAVNLGDEDIICFTPTRTLLYRGEGLLSDESIQEFSHDVERLDLSEGRRKSSFSLEYVDSTESFGVSNKRAQQVLERLLTGVLDAADVLGEEESVEGVYLFSELTVIITDSRLVKHIGTYVWDGDYEEYPFSKVTNLDFEEGSVATQIVLSVDGRPQRIKAPSDKAKKLRRTLTEALFAYYEVDTLEELNATISPDSEDETAATEDSGGLGLDDSISPLVDDEDDERDSRTDRSADAESGGSETDQSTDTDSTGSDGEERTEVLSVGPRAGSADGEESEEQAESAVEADSGAPNSTETGSETAPAVDPEEIEAMKEEIATLRTAVEEQNEEIEKQRETIDQLIEELRKYA